MHRRTFIKTAAAAAFITSLGQRFSYAATPDAIPYRILGHTGERVSLLGIGGSHIGMSSVAEATGISVIRTALDAGVNFLDNCWDYNGGESEIRMGKALRDGYRSKAFLMTKVDGRSAQEATKQLDVCLQRLQTDHLDLIQLHDISEMKTADLVFAPGGAVEAMVAAKQAGKVRYIGFTGHRNVDMHLRMLEVADQHKFVFDSVQMPLNVMDAHYISFLHKVVPILTQKNIAVLGMKSLAGGAILKSNTVTAVECLNFAMNLPVSVCIAGCDSMETLQQGMSVARNFKPLSQAEVETILAKTEVAAIDGQFEPYKTAWYKGRPL